MARINSRIFYTKGIKGALLVSAVAVLAAFIFLPAGRSVENNLDVPIVKAGECDPTSDALPCDPIGGGTPVKPKLSSSIIIILDTVPDDSQVFGFSTTGSGISSFSLDDYAGTPLSNTKTFSGLGTGTFTVTEGMVSGFDLVSINCSDPTSNSSGNISTRVATINLGYLETVTCTFINVKRATIHVTKITAPANDTTQFTIDASSSNGGLILNPHRTTLATNHAEDFSVLANKTYSITETVPAGWTKTSDTCQNLSPTPGQTINCSVTNTRKGHLIVQKTTLPGGDSTAFNITASGTGTITGSATGTVTDALDKDYEVTQGIYSVVETVPNGWTKTGDTCQNVSVVAGETKTCLITNTKDAPLTGNITVRKDAAPNDLRDFLYTMTGQSNFYLDDDDGVVDKGMFGDIDQPQSKTFLGLAANIDYTISETIPAYWNFGGVNCLNNQDSTPYSGVTNISSSQTSASVTLTLLPGADITCTFINEKFRFPTRTQGFWQTHTRFTSDIFEMYFGVTGMNIGIAPHKGPITNIELSSQSQLFGAYYSNISKKSNNKNRTATDKRRMQLLQQLVTAKLNCAAFNCPVSIQTMIADADSAYASGNAGQISTAIAVLDSYNQSGDTLIISPPYPWPGSATPGISQDLSDIDFWDNP
jgi:hypothetical protein